MCSLLILVLLHAVYTFLCQTFLVNSLIFRFVFFDFIYVLCNLKGIANNGREHVLSHSMSSFTNQIALFEGINVDY